MIEDEAEAEARQRSEAEARQREIDDLSAQQAMAESTKAMNAATQDMRDYALYSTILVAIGTGLLTLTLYLTREANRAAFFAAKAADKTADITLKIGKAQTTAYASVEDVQFGLGARAGANYRPIINSRWRNAGNTPAFDFGGSYHITVRVEGLVLIETWCLTNLEAGLIRIDPHQTESLHADPDYVSLDDYVKALREERARIEVDIVGSYRNAFDEVVPFRERFRSSKIFCNPNPHPGGEYLFNIKMAKYQPDE